MITIRRLLLLVALLCAVRSASGRLRAVALSDGWPIRDFELNESGSVLFAGGDAAGFADGLVLVTRERSVRIASTGDPVPGLPGRVFLGWGARKGELAVNDRDEAAFVGYHCPENVGPDECSRGLERSGIFRYSGARIEKIADSGDAPPGGPGGYLGFSDLRMNNRGTVAFSSLLGSRTPTAVFLALAGGDIRQAALENEPYARFQILSFNDADELVFENSSDQNAGIYRYLGRLESLIGKGDPAPEGGVFDRVSALSVSRRGEVLVSGSVLRAGESGSYFESGVFLRDRTGRSRRFDLNDAARDIQIDDNGDVTYHAASPDGSGIYRKTGEIITRLVGSGDPVPGRPDERLDLEFAAQDFGRFILTSSRILAFRAGVEGKPDKRGIFLWVDGSLHTIAVTDDAPADAEDGALQDSTFARFRVNRTRDVALLTALCCGRFREGIFVGRPLDEPAITNPDFELEADRDRASGWTTSWSSSGTGEAIQHCDASDVFSGEHALRLRVKGGGDVFVLSEPIAVTSRADYAVSARLRYALPGALDAVFFTVVQYDAAGSEIALREFRSASGDNRWLWELVVVPFRTLPEAATVRIRFGLRAGSESILDVDALR